jgi:hypothetical protein
MGKKIISRVLFILTSLIITKISFDYIYNGYLSYLPETSTLNRYINAPTSEFSTFRKQYTDALGESLKFGIAIFIISFSLLEYCYRTILKQNSIARTFESMKQTYNRELNELQPIIDEINELANDTPPSNLRKQANIDYSKMKL